MYSTSLFALEYYDVSKSVRDRRRTTGLANNTPICKYTGIETARVLRVAAWEKYVYRIYDNERKLYWRDYV